MTPRQRKTGQRHQVAPAVDGDHPGRHGAHRIETKADAVALRRRRERGQRLEALTRLGVGERGEHLARLETFFDDPQAEASQGEAVFGDGRLSEEAPLGVRRVLPIEDVRFRRIGLDRDRIAHLVPQAEEHRVVRDEALRLTG